MDESPAIPDSHAAEHIEQQGHAGLLLEAEGGDGHGLQLSHAAEGVETGESPLFWFAPSEVWEIRGADITVSPVHKAAAGMRAREASPSPTLPADL